MNIQDYQALEPIIVNTKDNVIRYFFSKFNDKVFYKDVKNKLSTFELKELIKQTINEYDSSNFVNGFIYNNQEYWFDKNTRISLLHSVDIISKTSDTFILWLRDKSININCTKLINFLNELEIYAIETKNITNQHLANIDNTNDRNELINYNITENYPNKITLNI